MYKIEETLTLDSERYSSYAKKARVMQRELHTITPSLISGNTKYHDSSHRIAPLGAFDFEETHVYQLQKTDDEWIASFQQVYKKTSNYVYEVKEDLNVFIDAFKNQRKKFKYLVATLDYEQGEISEDEFTKIEEDSMLNIKATNKEETLDKLMRLLKYTKDDFTADEIVELLEVDPGNTKEIIYEARYKSGQFIAK